ncbi:MAG TPA: LssY C-terminal domain-containing protein [Candidatus Andersenbacteria bacterium]|nr:LssY C-terminal domain-containing protein [Candidatus Andersenbacteria bacterium]
MWVEQLIAYVEHIGYWGYIVGFIASLLEAIAFVGVLVPGSIIVTVLGFISSKGEIHSWILVLCCILGAIIGDALSFYWGRNGTVLFSDTNKIFSTKYLARGKLFFQRHGYYSVFLGRFISGIRAFIPYIAGIFRMDVKQFFVWNIMSAIGWSLAHVYIGYFFGAAWRVAEKWSARAGLFLIVAAIFISILWYVARFLGRRAKRIARFLHSIWRSILHGIASNNDVIVWASAHPRTATFLKNRTRIDFFWGLPFSLLVIAFLYALLEFFGVVQGVVTGGVVVGADMRMENLLYAFRSGPVTSFFLWITMLGSVPIAIGMVVCASVILFLWQKERFIIPLWVSVAGSQLVGLIGKYELHRPRPSGIAVYTEQSFSFPSGHSIFAVALYGFLTYIAIRYARRWRNKIYIACFGLTVIFLIGLSRLYVGVHYFSDVWGGYLLGFLWLIIGISMAEWTSHQKRTHRFIVRAQSQPFALFGTGVACVLFVLIFVLIGHDTIEDLTASPPTFQTSSISTANALDIFSDGSPQYTETLPGNRQEPIAFIVTAPSEEAFVRAFTKAGWYPAEQLSFRSFIRLVVADVTGKPYPTAPITPSFWNQEVNDFAFEKPTSQDNIKQRNHARFWRTAYVTDSGDRVYVGIASLDLRIKWYITHAISPNIDEERAILLHDLIQGGTNLSYTSVQFVEPTLGKNFTGDAFFTDGKAIVVQIK